ncbi:MAG: hypothetical protein WCQ50_14105, partial [Spirochaetota bacterium]
MKMRLLIHDANVLIDLIDLGLLDRALTLPCAMETTDLVRLEVQTPDQEQVLSGCIKSGPYYRVRCIGDTKTHFALYW